MATELASSSLYTDNIPHEIGGSALDVATLKALYKFNTGALTTDSSGEGHTLTAISDPAEVAGVFGTAADFDGNDGYSAVDHADFKPTGNFSISAWVKSSATGVQSAVFASYAKSSTYRNGIQLGITAADQAYVVIYNNDASDHYSIGTSTTLHNGVWHHIVGTWDGSLLCIYVDGVLEADENAATPTYEATNYVRVACARASGSDGSFFTGSIDDLALWNGKALSATEVADIYGRLSAYYRFSTGALTTDSSHWNTLTAISDPAEVDGVFGKAVDLDGDDAYSAVDAPPLKPTGNFSLGMWVKRNGNPAAAESLFQSWAASTNYAGIWVFLGTDGYINFDSAKNTGTTWNTDAKQLTGDVSVTNNAWHFVVCTWDGSKMYIYVDGSEDTSVAWTNAPAYQTTNYPRIGCYNATGTNSLYFTGSLEDLFLFNGKALTVTEIENLYGILSLNPKYRGLMGVGA